MINKQPLIAIAVTLVLAVGIYLFFDTRPPKKEISEIVVETQEYDGDSFVSAFNETLDSSKQLYINELLFDLNSDNPSVETVDSIISFYEKNEQYNFSAWFHSAKAKILNTHEAWALAGTRQYSVGKNDAYEPEFNEVLRYEAIKSYQTAIQLDSSVLETRVQLASCYLDDAQKTMQGVTMLLDVVKEDSMQINANLLLGRFGIVSSQFDKAIRRLENVLSLQPENTEALFLLAESYVGLGEIDKAIETLEKCRDLIENEQVKKDLSAYILELKS
jgi:tetratricopeptide (TPR) repeat protein